MGETMTPEEARHAYELENARYWLRRAKENLDTATAGLIRAEIEFADAVNKVDRLESTPAPKAGDSK